MNEQRWSRREALQRTACGFGHVAFLGLAAQPGAAAPTPANPLALRPPHFQPRARRVIFLFMHGGVSHVDTFDPKPKLAEMNGKPLPVAKPKFEFAPTGNLLQSPWKFQKYGKSGIEVSELFPHIGGCIDDICVIRSMNGGNQVSHGPALLALHTGDAVFNRPSMGPGCSTAGQRKPGPAGLRHAEPVGISRRRAELRQRIPAGIVPGSRIGDGSTPFKDAAFSNLTPGEPNGVAAAAARRLRDLNRQHAERAVATPRLERASRPSR